LAHAVGAGQIGLHGAIRESLDSFFPLVRGQLHRTPKFHPTGLRSLAAVIGASPDQLSLNFESDGGVEFIRRFLLHALPDGFHRIRHCLVLKTIRAI
jgi:hypothetical protein